MIGKIGTIACVLALNLISATVFSGSMGVVTSRPSMGMYVGGTIGVSDLQDRTTHEVNPETHHLGAPGILGGGFFGYIYSFAPLASLSVEAFANATGTNAAIKHFNQNTGIQDNSENLRSRYNLGVRVLPGFQFTPDNEGHLIIGYANANFDHTDNGTYGYLDTSFNKSGLQMGAGWKTFFFYPEIFARLDVLYTIYAGQQSTGLGLPGSGSLFQVYVDQFNTLEADFSLVYQFN